MSFVINATGNVIFSSDVQGRSQTQQVGRAQHGPTYNGPIYLYRFSILSGRAQQTFSKAYALLWVML